MPNKNGHSYTKEFHTHIVYLARTGRTISELAEEFKLSRTTIYRWVNQADIDDGFVKEALTTSERDEISRLKREITRLKRERDILAKAAAWFARETNSMPDRSSIS